MKLVILDRDGTINHDSDAFIKSPAEFRPIAGSIEAIARLTQAGYRVVVATNQSGIARGMLTEALVDDTHRELSRRLEAGGARIDAYYYCPHHPTKGVVAEFATACDCRKPGRGMVDRAARDLDLDPARSFVVGDTWLDVGMARAAGARGILVRTGAGTEQARSMPPADLNADAIVDNLAAAASWILMRC